MSSAAPRVVALAARPAFAEILSEDAYRRLWLSGLCLNTERWMDLVVLGWLALELTRSPFMVGLAAFARSAPMMALGPFAGLVADRVHRGRVLLFTQALGLFTAHPAAGHALARPARDGHRRGGGDGGEQPARARGHRAGGGGVVAAGRPANGVSAGAFRAPGKSALIERPVWYARIRWTGGPGFSTGPGRDGLPHREAPGSARVLPGM